MSPPDTPPEPPIFFADRDLGAKIVPSRLRHAGFVVVAMQEHYGTEKSQEAKDHEWIPEVSALNMVILTNDTAMRFDGLIRKAIVESRARCFALARQDLTGPQMADRFIANIEAIHHITSQRSGPYFFHVHADRIVDMPLRRE
ncbi:hypothetical protein [Candidatus Protofrankia californiensis]|uniref:PIN-like domain-containing protein n=1 Tax=Candidatus Protofrankia californiensis TaxID=1839754 RepID=UPI001041A6D5|nr:hypothetical protein [Candidatus Protofrankia californiensis]